MDQPEIKYTIKSVSSTVDTSFPLKEYTQDAKYVYRNKFNNQKQFDYRDAEDSDLCRTILSDQEKFVLTLEPSMYHTIVDTLGSTLYWIKRFPKALFLIDMYFIHESPDRWHLVHGFFLEVLEKYGVDYKLINLHDGGIIINNFNIVTEQDTFPNERLKLINDEIRSYVSDPEQKPYRKVYVSRKKARSYFLWERQELDLGSPYLNDVRMHEEERLEKYFASIGYKIVYAEDFKTFREQAEFFYSVKSLITPSGSGLSNSLYMQPGSNVLEITVPIGAIFPEGFHYSVTEETKGKPARWLFEYHNIYKDIANALGHLYISIQTDKDPGTVINFIDSRPFMKDMLKNHW